MTRKHALTALTLALATGLLPFAASADSPWGKNSQHGRVMPQDFRQIDTPAGCPPGLAKKNNGCRPPGLAKREPHIWRPGERITSNYYVVRDPRRYNLDPRYTYWQSDDYVYRVDRQTGKVLALIGAIRNILN